ncbi:hypothetical protein [Brevibacterium pigmentatum]|uniref:hypothetical protein n=1 Tax=Brevibacterium pigmentatum TaxID=1496080 RepID=UPI001420CA1D|nr:hypothetical protein [Brevibacterium pigmentatum]
MPAEQAVDDLTEADVRRPQGAAVEVTGAEESVADDTAHHHGSEDHIGQGCAQQAGTAGDLQSGEGVDRLLGVADRIELRIGVGAAGGHLCRTRVVGLTAHRPALDGEFFVIGEERGNVGGVRSFGHSVATCVGPPQRGGGRHVRGKSEECREMPSGGAEVVRQQPAEDAADMADREQAEQGEQSLSGEAETVSLLGPDLGFRRRRVG